MALQAGQGAGEYMTRDEWLALGREAALVAFVLNGWTVTHVARTGDDLDTAKIDVYVLDGARKGEVMLGEQVIGKGLTTPLSKVKTGDEVAYRIRVGKNGATEYAQANAPEDGDLSQATLDLFESLKVGGTPPAAKAAPKANGKPATKAAAEKVPAAVGGGSEGGYDDEPDF